MKIIQTISMSGGPQGIILQKQQSTLNNSFKAEEAKDMESKVTHDTERCFIKLANGGIKCKEH